ncbi:hypothetical protein JKP88DRAFT_222824 [Tribonema minus]|uniref:Uncharacterized protein n=1 Tax=Tribonema minus TaxID=303371 RepID=A0A836CCQ9_9STRA|nr:hypothetical protein JKP88DRAFT_222824 [Tribonema minus]
MLTRQQQFRRLRGRSAISRKREQEGAPKVPVSLFAPGGELAEAQQATLFKSFSDGDTTTSSQVPGSAPRLRRTVSSDCVAHQPRSIFHSTCVATAQPVPQARAEVVVLPVATLHKKAAKTVFFQNQVKVILIPVARDMAPSVRADIWWTKPELQQMQRELVASLPYGCNLRRSILSLSSIISAAEEEEGGDSETVGVLPGAFSVTGAYPALKAGLAMPPAPLAAAASAAVLVASDKLEALGIVDSFVAAPAAPATLGA